MKTLYEMLPDQLLAAFLDACRAGDRETAADAISELRYRVWGGSDLPRDPRPDPKVQAELTHLATLWRTARARQVLESPKHPNGILGGALPTIEARVARKEAFPFCLNPDLCLPRGGRCPRDPVCGN